MPGRGCPTPSSSGAHRHRHRPRTGVAALVAAGLAVALVAWGAPAGAVILQVTTTGTYAISLRVGQAVGVDTVVFTVPGANVGRSIAVTGAPAIDVYVTPVRPPSLLDFTPRPVRLTVNSATALTCQSGSGCGTATIPFTQIQWVASANSNAASGDIQSGRFAGTGTQQISAFNANAGTALLCDGGILGLLLCPVTNTMSATRMTFSYDNDTLYPAGTYTGRVVFTATME